MRYSLGDKYGEKLVDTATKTAINAAKKFGDKYGKNLMDTAKKTKKKQKKNRIRCCKNCF